MTLSVIWNVWAPVSSDTFVVAFTFSSWNQDPARRCEETHGRTFDGANARKGMKFAVSGNVLQ